MEEWLESDLARAIIRDIDSSEVLSGECISSPVLGQIPPERLSGGTKTLLLMLNEPEKIFNASTYEDNCAKWILESRTVNGKKLLIADGAAPGSEIKDMHEYLSAVHDTILYAPESFEWLLLRADVIPGADSAQILSQPENYIDSSEYASWEQYFTQYLADMTKDHPLWCYSKKKLPAIYLSARVLRAAKKFMQLIIWD